MQSSALTKEINEKLTQAVDLCQHEQAEQAAAILKAEIEKLEALNLYNDGRADYYDFNTLMAMVMFQSRNPQVKASDIEEPLNRLYAMYGSVLLELGNLDAAKDAPKQVQDNAAADNCDHFPPCHVHLQKFNGFFHCVFCLGHRFSSISILLIIRDRIAATDAALSLAFFIAHNLFTGSSLYVCRAANTYTFSRSAK